MIADFQVENKINKPGFFQKISLVASTKSAIILRIFFLKISNADILFSEKTFI